MVFGRFSARADLRFNKEVSSDALDPLHSKPCTHRHPRPTTIELELSCNRFHCGTGDIRSGFSRTGV
jgi:hypothetical protein